MTINTVKTEFIHICEQGYMPAATAAEYKSVMKFKYSHIGCDKIFSIPTGAKCTQGNVVKANCT